MSDMFDIPAADEVQGETREPIPANTECYLVAVTEDDGSPKIRQGQKEGRKPWMSITFKVDGGEFDNRWVSKIMTVDPHNRYFREDFHMLTGIDISGGARVSQEEFFEKLLSGRWKATLEGTDDRGYCNIDKFLEREDYSRDGGAPIATGGADAAPASDDDEEFPF